MSTNKLFTSENIITLFSIGGKTMIGKFVTYPSRADVGSGANLNTDDKDASGIFSKLIGDSGTGEIDYSKFYFVKNPAEIIYNLTVDADGTARLTWSIVPFVYRKIKNNETKDVVVAYEKSQVSISDASSDTLKSDIVNGYLEIS